MDEYENLFFKIFRNKVLIKYILSLTHIRGQTIKYDSFNNVCSMIESDNLSLLRDKVKRKLNIQFPLRRRLDIMGDADPNDDEFIPIFETIKEPTKENLEFYSNLFTNYADYVIDFNTKLMFATRFNCLASFIVLDQIVSLSKSSVVIYQSLFELSMAHHSYDIIIHLIQNYSNSIDLSSCFLWSSLLKNSKKKTIITNEIKTNYKLLKYYINLFLDDKSNIPKLFSKCPIMSFKLSDLIIACKSILLVKPILELKVSIEAPELKNIKNGFSKEELNLSVAKSSNKKEIYQLLELYYSTGGCEKSLAYHLKFHENQDFNFGSLTTFPHFYINFKLCLKYANVNYLRHLKKSVEQGLKTVYKKMIGNILFKKINRGNKDEIKIKKQDFIRELVILDAICPMVLLFSLVQIDDIEMVAYFDQFLEINNNQCAINFNNYRNSYPLNIKSCIKSKEMLFFCFNNLKLKQFLLDEFYKSEVLCWVTNGRIDLLDYYNQLLQEEEPILPALANKAFSQFSGQSEYNVIFGIEYIIKKVKEYQITKHFDEKGLIPLVRLRAHDNDPKYRRNLECVKYIIENTHCQYYPFQIFLLSYGASANRWWIDFLDWIYTFRKEDIESGRCQLYEYSWYSFDVSQEKTTDTLDLYHLSLYLTGRENQLFSEIKTIKSNKDFSQLTSTIAKKGDIEMFDRLMDHFNKIEPSDQDSLASFIDIKSKILQDFLEFATFYCQLKIFNHINLNYNDILQFKNQTPKEKTPLINNTLFASILKKAISSDDIMLFNYFFDNLDYPCIKSILKDTDKDSIIFNNYKNYNFE
ncbi:hypothetical protein DICPUDRAFT_78509 [Dictyostelium purpureum]|uniref:Uncharacterized protein n=1 Tax=Dictyostelium purpureum TaxID=5786 RepID=F0ZJR8_DICPU|nr:uncharacterized protein DICPUDRAFT_78509 [Dictyostelium purpureum]EGC35816.1 hypothetical protein DICPUDRAFT_78509 [Dictyostelium purpureum]|eukprot:XP_003287653.1 hypothetical protein DICPUDRAFT_78509 [Dictyostelium purpureum]